MSRASRACMCKPGMKAIRAWSRPRRSSSTPSNCAWHSGAPHWRTVLAPPWFMRMTAPSRDSSPPGPPRWTGLSTDSEVASFYLLNAIKRRGIGRALFGAFMGVLADRGFTSCGLLTLNSNTAARRFYEAMGGRAGETRIDRRNNLDYEDVSYLWDNVRRVGRN